MPPQARGNSRESLACRLSTTTRIGHSVGWSSQKHLPDLQHSILNQLLAKVRREQFETWFRSLRISRVDDQEMEFSVTSQFVRDWILKNHMQTLKEVASTDGCARNVQLTLRTEDGWDSLATLGIDATVRPAVIHSAGVHSAGVHSAGAELAAGAAEGDTTNANTVSVVAGGDMPTTTVGGPNRMPGWTVDNPRNEPRTADHRLQPIGVGGINLVGRTASSLQLNPNYTFDKFVVGPCNRLAHASALAIGENPGSAYNPMFIHGNVGLGKTHLLQAICHTVTRRDPSMRVLYLSCEDFTNTFIKAIQSGSLDEFRNIHRKVDILVIDDVQFLANKEKTQDEFFHTFNALYDAQKQIVMSSDRSPVEIPTIEERLVSRFKWGLVAEIEAPCFETRVAIVRRKAKGRGIELSDEVSCFIAERVTANIRELEGAVIKVVGIAAITDRPITVELAEEALRGVAVTRLTQISPDDVIGLITSEFAITARDLTGKSRTQAISLPRQIAMYLLREHTELSLEDIGRVFGNRDHTTVLYAVTKIRDRSTTDRLFKDLLEGLSSRLLGRPGR
jgi:chromosomal replication initiator protein